MPFVVLALFFGLATAIVGKIKGSSFFLWFLIGAVLPVFGLLAALLYRFESNELRRRCDECGKVLPITNQVCTRCGADLDFPREAIVPRNPHARLR
jgi:hypothetical protein